MDFSAVAAIILRMVKVLSDHYGMPFQRDRARAIVIALMAGAAPAGLGTVTTSTLSFFVPGGLFVGLAVSSVTAAACTRTIGRIFVEHFESGATLADFPVFKRRADYAPKARNPPALSRPSPLAGRKDVDGPAYGARSTLSRRRERDARASPPDELR